MRLVLVGVAWTSSTHRNVAVLTGVLFESVPPGVYGVAKSLGVVAVSGKWSASSVAQFGVGTVLRAQYTLRRMAKQSHFGEWPLYAIGEDDLVGVHEGEPVGGSLPAGIVSSGVARPGQVHRAPLPCVTTASMTGGVRPAADELPMTPRQRVEACQAVARRLWRELSDCEASRRRRPTAPRLAPQLDTPPAPPPPPSAPTRTAWKMRAARCREA